MELVLRHVPAGAAAAGAQERTVLVRSRSDGRYEIEFKTVGASPEEAGRVLLLDAPRAANGARSVLVEDGRQRETVVAVERDGSYTVAFSGNRHRFEVFEPLEYRARAGAGGPTARGGRVVSYMPGRVVSLLVAVGDAVEAGRGLVVLEAMKMQNEIAAERAGVVKAVHVQPGQTVEGGDPLFDLE